MDPLEFTCARKLLSNVLEFLLSSDFFQISFITVMIGIHALL